MRWNRLVRDIYTCPAGVGPGREPHLDSILLALLRPRQTASRWPMDVRVIHCPTSELDATTSETARGGHRGRRKALSPHEGRGWPEAGRSAEQGWSKKRRIRPSTWSHPTSPGRPCVRSLSDDGGCRRGEEESRRCSHAGSAASHSNCCGRRRGRSPLAAAPHLCTPALQRQRQRRRPEAARRLQPRRGARPGIPGWHPRPSCRLVVFSASGVHVTSPQRLLAPCRIGLGPPVRGVLT